MNQKYRIPFYVLLAACLLLSACNMPLKSGANATKTAEAGGANSVLETAKAMVNANLTATAAAGGAVKPTTAPVIVKPTTAPAVIPTIAVPQTQPTEKVVSGTDATQLAGENNPDGTKFLPGTAFTKTWRLMNTGSSTWGTDYKFVYIQGDKLGAADEYRINVPVEPGKIYDMNVPMKAPDAAGTYKGYWKIKNPGGATFGPGVTSFSVEIIVAAATATATVPPTATTVPPTATVAAPVVATATTAAP
jgi:hypothetical protein